MPKTSIAQSPLVMIRTFSARLRARGRSLIGRSASGRRSGGAPRFPGRPERPPRSVRFSLASNAGDTLIEVLVSALLVGLIVVGTFSGLNSANRSTSIDRARSQADSLAEQNEEQLHSLSVTALKKLEEENGHTSPVTQNGTKFEVTSNAKYVIDDTATTSCSSTALSAEYIQTSSTVYSKAAFGATKPVVETGIVSPPPDTSLVVEVTNQLAKPVAGMEVQVTGPSDATAVTNTNGCAVLALEPGEYAINVHLTNYVDPNWFTESKNDASAYPLHIYLPAQTTTKKEYRFAKAAALNSSTSEGLEFEELNPVTGVHEPAKAVNAILESTQMAPTTRLLEPEGSSTYLSSITTTKRIYPFTSKYTVYAGTCAANRPPEETERTSVEFPEGSEQSAKLVLPALVVKVYEGTKLTPGKLVSTAPEIFLSDTDEGCEHTWQKPKTVAPVLKSGVLEYPKGGALEYPGQPWGTYTVCLNDGTSKYLEDPGEKNDHPEQAGTPVNFYEGEALALKTGSCP
jgi:Tfp pilus assembly protein PilV